MKIDIIQTYIKVQQQLQQEKADLEARLRQINQVLGESSTPAPAPSPAPPSAVTRFQNPLSLPQAVLQVTSMRPMTRTEILEAVQALGYRFSAKDPMKSLNPLLYGKKSKFIRVDGKFSPAPGASRKSARAKTASVAQAVKPKFSPQARARLAALARARWAKAKRAGKTRL